ncbi:MAG: hypothetical protein WC445_04860 [Patescibacteria group bacterium]
MPRSSTSTSGTSDCPLNNLKKWETSRIFRSLLEKTEKCDEFIQGTFLDWIVEVVDAPRQEEEALYFKEIVKNFPTATKIVATKIYELENLPTEEKKKTLVFYLARQEYEEKMYSGHYTKYVFLQPAFFPDADHVEKNVKVFSINVEQIKMWGDPIYKWGELTRIHLLCQ